MTTPRNKLLEEVSAFLVIYLKAGQVDVNPFIKRTDLPIERLDQLLKMHFLIKEDVKRFVRTLPDAIRRLKTSTAVNQSMHEGQVKGQIDWQKTVINPRRIGEKNNMLFSVKERSRKYAIKENLVLLEALDTLYTLLFEELDTAYLEKLAWFSEWESLKELLNHELHHNIYLSRVRKKQRDVTYRMIVDTRKHRNPLYRYAAFILLEYRRIMAGDFDQQEMTALLKETFIYPKKEEVLFELYWIVMLIKQNTKKSKLHLLDHRNNLVAEWDDDAHHYNVYHDSIGSGSLHFLISKEEVRVPEHPYIYRKLGSMQKANDLAADIFDQPSESTSFWNGRPDVLVEIYDKDTGELARVIIGEVKHTSCLSYAIDGLRELVDYITFVKGDHDFLNETIPVQGILLTDRLDGFQASPVQTVDITAEWTDVIWRSL